MFSVWVHGARFFGVLTSLRFSSECQLMGSRNGCTRSWPRPTAGDPLAWSIQLASQDPSILFVDAGIHKAYCSFSNMPAFPRFTTLVLGWIHFLSCLLASSGVRSNTADRTNDQAPPAADSLLQTAQHHLRHNNSWSTRAKSW